MPKLNMYKFKFNIDTGRKSTIECVNQPVLRNLVRQLSISIKRILERGNANKIIIFLEKKKKNKVPVTVIWNLDHQSMGTAPCVYITNLMLKDRKQNHRHPTSLSLPSHPTYI